MLEKLWIIWVKLYVSSLFYPMALAFVLILTTIAIVMFLALGFTNAWTY